MLPSAQQTLEENDLHQILFIFKGPSTQNVVQKSVSKTFFLADEHLLETRPQRPMDTHGHTWPGIGKQERRGRLETQNNLGRGNRIVWE